MIILVGIGLTFILYQAFYTWSEKVKLFTYKPFSCHFCLSFWVSIGFFLTTGHYPALIIPIAYEIVRKITNRL